MDDYIRRSDAINAMANILVSPMVSDDEYNIGVRRCMSSVDAIPAADVRPVNCGTWMIGFGYPNPPGTYCSKCGFAWSEQIAAVTLEPVLSRIETNFCPNCGADMGGTP